MKYRDVQDTRKKDVVRAQKATARRRKLERCLEKISPLHNSRKVVSVFGATFAI